MQPIAICFRPVLATVGLLVVVLAAACGGAAPKARDAGGRPVFDPVEIRHPADQPYFCFTLVTRDGNEVGQCQVIKDWCANELQQARDAGNTILSGCRPVEQVACFVAYSHGAMLNTARGMCWEDGADCSAMNTLSAEMYGPDYVSTCQALDRSFQPPA